MLRKWGNLRKMKNLAIRQGNCSKSLMIGIEGEFARKMPMAANYLELSALFLKELQNRQEMEQACSRLGTQFAQGFIHQLQWPATQIDFLPMEGNLKELPKGLGVQNGPGQALRYVDGAYQVGLTVLILAQPPGQPPPQDGSGVRF